ncbi:MAG: NAD(P)/FAD-dependent oxidoreductase [Actinomycetota bacterium]|nr:NAD(P)/FAD-dependent oxidoreductase [Actinomycetota bacterium]
MADQEFDVVVIGAGPAGEVAAGRCSGAGLETAIIEVELVGGECSYWACMPSKGLLRPGEILAEVAAVPGAAEKADKKPDAAAALRRRNEIVTEWDDSGQLPWLDDAGVKLIRGRARFQGPRRMEVEHADGTRETVTARRSVIVATGSHPAIPPIDGLRDMRVWGNREATAAQEAPRRLIVLGGGPVGVEMAQAWVTLGAEEVTLIEAAGRLLPREEPFAGEELAASMKSQGIRVLTGTSVVKASRHDDEGPVTVTLEDDSTITGDEVLVAVGRRPNTGDLGLDTIGLEAGSYVEVDDRMRALHVKGDWLYAIGDVNGRALLTHIGKYQGRIAADDILGAPGAFTEERAIPRVTFTHPQIAAVGLTHAQAVERGIRARSVSTDISEVAGSSVTGVGVSGKVQATFDADREVMVGATFTGPGVADMVHAATIAIVGEVPIDRLKHAVPSFPTVSEVWLDLIESFESSGGES